MNHIQISEIKENKAGYTQRINELLTQLMPTLAPLTDADVEAMIASDNSHLFFIHSDGDIAGMLTVGSYLTPSGAKYWIEDVVVDDRFRGQSLGRKLVEHAISYVSKQGAGTLMLTSNPARIAANKLYQSLGMEQKETNVYRMTFEKE